MGRKRKNLNWTKSTPVWVLSYTPPLHSGSSGTETRACVSGELPADEAKVWSEMWTTWSLVRSGADQNSSRLVFLLVMTSIRPVIPLTVVPITAATRLRDNNQYWCQSALDPYPAPTFPRRSRDYRFSSRLPEFGDQCSQRGGKEQRRVVAKTLLMLFFY